MSMRSEMDSIPCSCDIKDKNNWYIFTQHSTMNNTYYYVSCKKCHNTWKTTAKYCKELKGYK